MSYRYRWKLWGVYVNEVIFANIGSYNVTGGITKFIFLLILMVFFTTSMLRSSYASFIVVEFIVWLSLIIIAKEV